MTRYAYLDGDVGPLEEAEISVQDRGFLFGDGVYDVVRIANGSPFRFDRHVDRLLDNATRLEFSSVPDAQTLREAARRVLERSDLAEGMLYMQLTRGSGPRRARPDESLEPTVLVYVDELRRQIDSLRESGASATLVPEIRWKWCHVKTTNLLPKVLMKRRASQSGCYEAIFTSESGEVWEGTSTNVFIREGDVLRTPEHRERVLPGVTRREVLDIAAESGRPVEISSIHVEDLYAADEVFLTGTLTEVLGVVEIDGEPVGGGEVGETTREIRAALLDRREAATE